MREFEWDDGKAKRNLAKHGISFDEARLAFSDPYRVSRRDERYDYDEDRWWTVGMIEKRCLMLLVAHTIEGNGTETIRIISARPANNKERRLYGNRKGYRG